MAVIKEVKQLQALLEHTHDRVLFKDVDRTIVASSRSWMEDGNSCADSTALPGQNRSGATKAEIAQLLDRLEQEVLGGAPSASAAHSCRGKDGIAKWAETSVYPVKGEDGAMLGLLIVDRDLPSAESSFAGWDEAENSTASARLNTAGDTPVIWESPERVRQGIAAGEFVLFYQPCVNMSAGKVVGAEALLRWQHPQRGILSPSSFLPPIAHHPAAVELGEWVIGAVLAQMEQWLDAGLDLPISVNVGPRQLQAPNFVERLAAMVAAHPRAQPSRLQLDILESSVPKDADLVTHLLEGCREIGVTFALDGFGSDSSSLNDLKRSPGDVLKIDPSFVRDILDKPEDLSILEGMLSLASGLRRTSVAEGVESVDHGLMLLRLGCELGQGYGIAKPMPAAEFPEWAANWRPDPRWKEAFSMAVDQRPLLYASAEHRAWITAIEDFLKQETHVQPPMSRHQCRLGMWLDMESQSSRSNQPEFQSVVALHWRLHALATGILKLQSQGRAEEGLGRAPELHSLHEKMVTALQALTPKSAPAYQEQALMIAGMSSQTD